ncbi:MAG: HAMP domain-containing sensor histidine kinase [Gammaproteobacteria bacterium]
MARYTFTAGTLRERLVFATAGLIIALAILFSSGLYFAFEIAEDTLFEAHLEDDVDSLLAIYEHDPALLAVPVPNFTVHVVRGGVDTALPFEPAQLARRDGEVVIDGVEFHVITRSRGDTTYYFQFDETAFETFEDTLFRAMAVVVGSIVVVAGLVSLRLARHVIAPLTALARDVSLLEAGDDSRLAPSIGRNDEIGVLARALARYHARISALLEREREFSADVSHELRTPLTGIQGAAELLARRTGGLPGCDEVLQRIRRGCRNMTTLIEALLFLARDPASMREMLAPVDLAQVVATQVAEARALAPRADVRIEVTTVTAGATVDAVPVLVDIVVGNLLKNAVKHTDRDRVSVQLDQRTVIIEDYGPGIEPALQASMFERYARGDAGEATGSGIGLALVRRFCDQCGWHIEVRSAPQVGTRVTVRF